MKKKEELFSFDLNKFSQETKIYIYKTEIFIKFPRNIHGC